MYVGDGTVIRSREVKPSYRQRPPLRDPEVRREVPAAARSAAPQERPLVGAGRPTGAKAEPNAGWEEEGQGAAEVAIRSVAAPAPPAPAMPAELPTDELPADESPPMPTVIAAASLPPAEAAPAAKRAPRRSRADTTQAALLGRIADLEQELANLAARIQSLESPADPAGEHGPHTVAQAYVYTGGGAELAVGPVTVNRQKRSPKAP